MNSFPYSRIVVASLLVMTAPALAEDAVIDKSTVRIFALGTVGIEDIEMQRGNIQVADAKAGHGTGFVAGNGVVLTAAHVVEGARHIVVRLPNDGGFFAARVAHAEIVADIAVLVFEPERAKGYPKLVLSRDRAPRVRETVFAVGYPIDASRTSPQSAKGIIAGRLDDGTIQVDMALNPGNSGGPLVDEKDQVVGMVVARGALDKGVQGIGYAVPVARLHAAVAEAQRKRNGIAPLTERDHTSAVVVDGMVQHGALHELRDAVDVKGLQTAKARIDEVLQELVERLDDPDLLVYVAAAMWNAAVSIELADANKLAEVRMSQAQARELASRLRASAVRSVTKATQQDPTIGERSPFVGLALRAPHPAAVASTYPAAYQPAAYSGGGIEGGAAYQPVQALPGARTGFAFRVSPEARWNPAVGSLGTGYGIAADIRFIGMTGRTAFLLGGSWGKVSVSGTADEFAHSFLVADAGVAFLLGTKLEVSGSVGIAYYASSVSSTTASPSGQATSAALTARASAAYRFGPLHLGTAVRAFNGPTMWLEPLYLGLVF